MQAQSRNLGLQAETITFLGESMPSEFHAGAFTIQVGWLLKGSTHLK